MDNDSSSNKPPPQQQNDLQELPQINDLKSNLIYDFNDENKTAKIIGNNNLSNSIFIPRSVNHNMQDYIVTEIAESSFSNFHIQSVQFQEDSEVRIIGKNAFSNSMITNITIPRHVSEICENAFDGCELLNQINFQENSELVTIGEKSFRQCAIEKISIPPNVSEICPMAFEYCNQLKNIEFPANSKLRVIGNKAFCYTKIENINIPASVVELKDGWISGMHKLKSIKIAENGNLPMKISDDENLIFGKIDPNKDEYDLLLFSNRDFIDVTIPPFIKKIASNAFSYSQLSTIKIPKQVTEICQYAFYNCKNLQLVQFEDNSDLKIIGEYAFSCSPIETITIPKYVTKISEGTFDKCWKMRQINFYDDCELKTIDKFAFTFTEIDEIKLPASVIELKDEWLQYAFQSIKVDENNKRYKCFDNKFVAGKTNLESEVYDELIFVKKSVKKFTIPSFIKRIGPFAFYKCNKLKKVKFEDASAKLIVDNRAFLGSPLESLQIRSDNVIIKEGFFIFYSTLNRYIHKSI